MKPRLIVFGYARHGKDTACEYLQSRFGLTFSSSSWMACQLFLYEQLRERYGYTSMQECFEDRMNHRKVWFDAIRAYNDPDLCRLGRQLFSQHDVYCGIRNDEEFYGLKKEGIFDLAVWIDASERKPPEASESMTLSAADADLVVSNNGSLEEFHRELDLTIGRLLEQQRPSQKVA